MLPPVVFHPRARRRGVVALLVLGGGVLLTLPASARSAPDLAGLDLRLQPSDVVSALPPGLSDTPVPPRMHDQSVPEIVSDVDRVAETPTPNRRVAGTDALGDLSFGEGVLQDLLENKTIPLFRVRVAPPF